MCRVVTDQYVNNSTTSSFGGTLVDFNSTVVNGGRKKLHYVIASVDISGSHSGRYHILSAPADALRVRLPTFADGGEGWHTVFAITGSLLADWTIERADGDTTSVITGTISPRQGQEKINIANNVITFDQSKNVDIGAKIEITLIKNDNDEATFLVFGTTN